MSADETTVGAGERNDTHEHKHEYEWDLTGGRGVPLAEPPEWVLLGTAEHRWPRFHKRVIPQSRLPACGRHDDGVLVRTDDALAEGYAPCGRCWPHIDAAGPPDTTDDEAGGEGVSTGE
jgi:hypothetical protein